MDISSMLEVEVQEVADSKENVTPTIKPQTFACQNFSNEENDFYKLTYGADVASVRFLRLHCTMCNEHIGSAPAEAHNMHEHPVLRTLLCAKCREFYGTGTFEQGNDNTDMYCRWCANGGNLYCCSYCSNTFCSKCIKRNFDASVVKAIEEDESWKCFVCDPKDLFPLRSIARALKTHIETVTRLLENDKLTNPKEIEEKMHLDETKCCSRKRKRRKRLSQSEDDEEDINYVPELERTYTPPAKKRRSRCNTVRNIFNTMANGHADHEYHAHKKVTKTETESEQDTYPDPADLLIPCEQTMIEGDTILNSNMTDSTTPMVSSVGNENSPQQAPIRIINRAPPNYILQKNAPNMAINPVPLANLLQKAVVANATKKIRIMHSNKRLVAVPLPSNVTLIRPPGGKFIMSKNLQSMGVSRPTYVQIPASKLPMANPSQSVIDLDSDDEPVVVEKDRTENTSSTDLAVSDRNVDMNVVVAEPIEELDEETLSTPANTMNTTHTRLFSANGAGTADEPVIITDHVVSLKSQKREQQFKQMLKLQSQEIDSTMVELKTKVFKIIQTSYNKPQQEEDMLSSALTYTKRFHRALKKTMVELSHINDRVVRDYIHWKKKTDGQVSAEKKEEVKTNDSSSDLPLEMVCERESETEDDDDDDDTPSMKEEYSIEASNVPPDFSSMLDHLSIFKRKLSSVKAVGDSSVLTEEKACQAYDVPWKDYEKCIGYSLVKKDECDDEKVQEEQLQPDENFGKYQEQFLFYLQHIEDFGIETDDLKGLPDPNHIPLKDLIDGTSPFIMDMLERLSPVALSNGCTSPNQGNLESTTEESSSVPEAMETNEEPKNLESEATASENHESNKSEENVVPTSKAVQELVKMVTKLSEDLCTEDPAKRKEVEEATIDDETFKVVQSILDANHEEQTQVTDEIMDICTVSNNECVTLD